MSSFTPQDAHFMAQALRLAERGRFTVRPNPAVGCLIVHESVLVGEGWHMRAGTQHAEVHALRMAGDRASGATAYVTLEPCSHHGRTPPCCDALVAAGIKRVVVAMQDPNPLVAGKGIARMRAAGIQVDVGLLEASARLLNTGFLMRMEQARPWVRVKVAASLDGQTALANGQSKWITGEAARADVQQLRALSGAIVTGIGTVLSDDPSLNVRLPEFESFQPLRVILDSQLRLPLTAHMLSLSGPILVVCLADALQIKADKVSLLQAKGVGVLSVAAEGDRLSLTAVLQLLAHEFHINDVLLEAGATLAGAFVEAGLVDELWWYGAACLMGSEARSAVVLHDRLQMSAVQRYRLIEQRSIGQDVRLRLSPLADLGIFAEPLTDLDSLAD